MSAYDDFLAKLVATKLPANPTFYGNRSERIDVTLLDNAEHEIGPLHPKTLKMHSSVSDTIRTGGSMDVLNPDDVPGGWLNKKVRVNYSFVVKTTVQGLQAHVVDNPSGGYTLMPVPTPENVFSWGDSLGIFIPTAPSGSRGPLGTPRSVELYDKLLILNQDQIATTYQVPKGTVVTDRVISLIQGAGGGNHIKIPASTERLAATLTFEAGSTKLQIVNNLLAAINYWALWVDKDGWFRSSHYVEPQSRGLSPYILTEGENCIYLDTFADDEDTFDIPNKVIYVSRVSGDKYSYTAIATNTDPNSPFSYVNRGNRWITLFDSNVEATSGTVLGNLARRKLIDASSNIRTYQVQHAYLPFQLNDVAVFNNPTNHINGHHCTVQETQVSLDDPGVMMTTTLREIGWTG